LTNWKLRAGHRKSPHIQQVALGKTFHTQMQRIGLARGPTFVAPGGAIHNPGLKASQEAEPASESITCVVRGARVVIDKEFTRQSKNPIPTRQQRDAVVPTDLRKWRLHIWKLRRCVILHFRNSIIFIIPYHSNNSRHSIYSLHIGFIIHNSAYW
jgi:hypothetical protein